MKLRGDSPDADLSPSRKPDSSTKLEVILDQKVTFIYPESAVAHESVVRGIVKLSLSANRKVKALIVVLKGVSERFAAPGGRRLRAATTTIEKKVSLDLDKEELEMGDHVFHFEFSVAATTASTCCSGGGGPLEYVSHNVSAVIAFAGRYTVASAAPAQLYLVALQGEPGEIPEAFEITHEHNGTHLGPVRMHLFSPHLILGALVYLRLYFAATPVTIHILAIRVYLTESPTVYGRAQPSSSFNLLHVSNTDCPTSLAEIHNLDVNLPSGASWTYERTVRAPGCETARPTTLAGSDAKVVTTSSLSVEIQYSLGEGGQKKVSTSKLPVTVGSCIALIDSIRLPQYVRAPPKTRIRRSPCGDCGTPCLCEYSLAELLEQDQGAFHSAKTPILEPQLPRLTVKPDGSYSRVN